MLVLPEPDGFTVGCFNTDCPEHGEGTGALPWLVVPGESMSKSAATALAAEHRAVIRAYWQPERCGSCGQRVPAVSDAGTTVTLGSTRDPSWRQIGAEGADA